MNNINELLKHFEEIAGIGKKRKDSDENYVIDLCDEVLGEKAYRQHSFDFLKGDPGKDGKRRKLPVDAYYPSKDLVVEYNERQHTESVPLFDDKKTISGVSRGEQRKLYDERRKKVLPQHNIKLVVISCFNFELDGKKKIKRNRRRDLEIVKKLFEKKGIELCNEKQMTDMP